MEPSGSTLHFASLKGYIDSISDCRFAYPCIFLVSFWFPEEHSDCDIGHSFQRFEILQRKTWQNCYEEYQ